MKNKKVIINRCYGGFSLSPKGINRYAELKGWPCYLFEVEPGRNKYTLVTAEEASGFLVMAYTVPNPQEYVGDNKDWKEMSQEERILQNQKYDEIFIDDKGIDRDDPCLVQAVEELGEEANGNCGDLRVIEIPADVDFEIDEYDGMECVRETHRVWS